MLKPETGAFLRAIPAMEDLLGAPWAQEFLPTMGREQVKHTITEALDELRRELRNGADRGLEVEVLAVSRAKRLLQERAASTLKPVVNATGVIIHTNLGRAPLAPEALAAVNALAGTYSTLEYSPESGERGGRNAHVEWALRRISGAEAALVVNNNAAAVLLALSALARDREVIVSRGELVEIGGSFRIPEILAFSGADMKAVGCTNSTRIDDYRNALTERTAALLKVHPSNYRITGFVKTTGREELAELAASRGLVFMEDLGSGLLCPLNLPFADREHAVRDCLAQGSGIVTFSGDKLLGGPQIGVIAGAKHLVDKIRAHQLLRALRVDKMTLAAFEATLRLYLAGRQGEIPVIRMIETDSKSLLKKARALCRLLVRMAEQGARDIAVSVVEAEDAVGGGSFPTDVLAGFGVELRSPSRSAETLAYAFRTAPVPVIPAVRDGGLVLHVRTLLPGDENFIAAAFSRILGGEGN
jgi:L-seryl-tRNA(Ser) seleniumtransferase